MKIGKRWLPRPDENDGTGGGAAAALLNQQQQQQQQAPWYGELPQTNDEEKAFATWAKEKNFKDAPSALKAAMNAEKMIGASIQPWKEGEDPTQWPGWEKLGVPKDAAGYKIKRPEMPEGLAYDEAGEKAAIELATKMRAPPHLVQGFLDFTAQQRIAEHNALAEAGKAEKTKLEAVLTEWQGKGEKDANVAAAQRAAKVFGIEKDILGALEGFVGSAGIIKGLAAIGATLKEGQLVNGNNAGGGREGAKQKLDGYNARLGKGEKLTKEEMADRDAQYAHYYDGKEPGADKK